VRPLRRRQLEPHAARRLLDAQLLADVYINLTRGQDALLIDVASNEPAQGTTQVTIDLSQFELPVITAGEQELAAHEAVLSQLDKSSNGRTLFRQNGGNAVA
jgi:DNA polymerase-3 subunit epsilon